MGARLRFWKAALLQSSRIAFQAIAVAGLLAGLTVVALLAWLRDIQPVWALAIVLLLVLFLLAEGSYRQWRIADEQLTEARTRLETVERQFPDCEIEVSRPFYFDREGDGKRLLFFPLRVTNREAARRVSLHVEFGLEMFRSRKLELGRSFYSEFLLAYDVPEEKRLPDPFEVEPQSSREGEYIADGSTAHGLAFDDDELYGFMPASDDDWLVVLIRDHVTGQSVAFPVPDTWTRGPASGV